MFEMGINVKDDLSLLNIALFSTTRDTVPLSSRAEVVMKLT